MGLRASVVVLGLCLGSGAWAATPTAAVRSALDLPAEPKAVPYVHVERNGGEVRGVIADVLPMSVEHVLNEVIFCYAAFPDWFPLQTKARYVAPRVGNTARIYGQMEFPWPIGLRDFEAIITGSYEPSRSEYRIDFRHAPGTGNIKTMYGHWLLQAHGPDEAVVVYDSTIDFDSWVPGFLLARGTESFLPAILEKMATRTGTCPAAAKP